MAVLGSAGSAWADPYTQGCYQGTYTVPADVHDVDIVAVGQAGLAGSDASSHGGGLGGMADQVHAQYVAVTPGEVLYYGTASPTVPGGGQLYSATPFPGAGGDGSFVSTSKPTMGVDGNNSGFSTCLVDPSSFLVVAAGGGGGGGGDGGPGGTGGNAGVAGNPGDTNELAAGAGGSAGTLTAGGAGGAPGSHFYVKWTNPDPFGGTPDCLFCYVGGDPGEPGVQAGTDPTEGDFFAGDGGETQVSAPDGYGGGGGGGFYGGGGGGGDAGDGGGGGGGGSSYASSAATLANIVLSSAAPNVTITAVEPGSVDLLASPNPGILGQPETLTAKVLPADATGTVLFTDSGTVIGQANVTGGSATLTYTWSQGAQAGAHNIVAHYSGDETHTSADSASTLVEIDELPTVQSGAAPSTETVTYGQQAGFTVQGAGLPGPTIQWELSRDGGATYSPIAGATHAAYQFTPHGSDSGNLYRAVLTNEVGSVASPPATLTVNPAPLTVTASSPTMTVGGTVPTITGTITGFQNGDTAASLTGTLSCDSTPAASSSLAAGTYFTDCSGLLSTDYTITYDIGVLTVSKRVLTVTADDKSMVYGGTVPALTVSYSGFVGTDDSSSLGGSLSCNTTATSSSPVTAGGYAIGCTGQTSDKYEISYVPGTLTVEPATVHVDGGGVVKTYGNTDPTPTAVLRASDFVNGDSATSSGITGSASCAIGAHSENAGTYPGVITCTPGSLSAANYTFVAGNAASLTINSLTVHIDADAAQKTYGDSDPTPTAVLRASDFVNGASATSSGITGSASCTIGAHSENAGTYTGVITCTPGSLSSANYTFVAGNAASLTISQVAVHVDANAAQYTYGASDPTASGVLRASDFVNGDTATSSGIAGSANCAIAAHSPNAGTYTGVITCTPGSLSSTNYNFVAGDPADLTISQATVHVDASAAQKTYGDSDPTATAVLRASDFKSSDTASTSGVTGSASCTIGSHSQNAGSYTGVISCTAGNLSAANYTFVAGNAADLTINQATVHVDAGAAQKTYGASDPTPSGGLRASDFVNGDTATSSGITGSASCTIGSHSQNAGTYTGVITCTPGSLSAANYAFVAGKAADLTINRATVHVDASAAQKTYGDSDPTPAPVLRASDFKYSDTASTSGITGSASCTIGAHSQNAGTYTGAISCSPGSLSSTNYTFVAGNPANLTINQAKLTVTADSKQITYGSPLPSFTYTISGVKYADTLQSVVAGAASCGTSGVSGSPSGPAGSYPITCTVGTLSTSANYVLGYQSGTLTIAKKQATLTYNTSTSLFVSTGSATATTAGVTLNATLTPGTGGTADLTKGAPVTFLLFKSTDTTMNPSTPDASCTTNSVSATGAASCTVPSLAIDNWTVIVMLGTVSAPGNGYFAAPDSDAVVITVYQPTTGIFATGGGFVTDPGYKNLPVAISSSNQHGNFGFEVRYKTGTTPMGQAVYTFRGADGYDYIVKSNSWQGGGLAFGTNTASFTGRCNVTVINPATGQAVSGLGGGNFSYRVDVTDNGKSSSDTYAISVYTATGSLYHQAGTTGTQLALAGGNLTVHAK